MQCQASHSHIVDSRFYRAGYTTEEGRRVFCDYRRMQRWLDVELVLAKAQAELDIIPLDASQALEKTAFLSLFNIESIQQDIANTGHSLIPLLNEWQRITPNKAAQFIHYGATTQDIQDTAQVLEIKDIVYIIERDLSIITQELMRLADQNKDLVMIGRTHGQHALPTTLGLKFAVWLDEILRHSSRVQDCKSRLLVSQLFGGVGTMSAFGKKGIELLHLFSLKLDLSPPLVAWHTARDRFAELLSIMASISGTLAKIANEICQLARDEIGELEEPFHTGKIGSTTMPHKRNPELCEQVVVLAKLIKANAGLGFDALINEHERDYRSIRLEWVSITESSLFLTGALSLMKNILKNLIIHENTIRNNVSKAAAAITTEAVMFSLGEKIGKQNAHKKLYELTMMARNSEEPIENVLTTFPDIVDNISKDKLKKLLDPESQIGLSSQLVENVLEQAAKTLSANNFEDKLLDCPLTNRCVNAQG
ncbi:MAG: adenylosuccinate lyase family protein [Proteobacteria bacterium]|nr:adenylosuccinate lyase family protein [Pseudomonadota bacterium]MBU1708475.1 adenylosuccinate lyase family protein [Pseudomonadota bacterium]